MRDYRASERNSLIFITPIPNDVEENWGVSINEAISERKIGFEVNHESTKNRQNIYE